MPRRARSLSIVSGGQTGADRGALSAAMDCGIPCGGWCPEGRKAEDGAIPPRFPVRELPGAGYAERTKRNVADADGTVVVYCGELEGGSALTASACRQQHKPLCLIDRGRLASGEGAEALAAFITEHDIDVLNVAGPRASKWPDAERCVREILSAVFDLL